MTHTWALTMRQRLNRWSLGVLLFGGVFTASAMAQNTAPAPFPQTAKINELLAKAWADNGLKPSPRANDYEFLRRVFLDLIGRIPSSDEVRDFEKMTQPNKRQIVINRLLREKKYEIPEGRTGKITRNYAQEYAQMWSNLWTVWLMSRNNTHPVYRDQMQLWLQEKIAEGASHKQIVEELLTAKGKTNDNGAVNYILHQMGESTPAGSRDKEGYFDMVPITSRTTRLFLGLQTQCTQCHDHPFNPSWKQSDFWGVNVFFRQVARDKTPTPPPNRQQDMMMQVAQVELKDDPSVNTSGTVYYERRNAMVVPTRAVFLKDLKDADSTDPEKRKLLPKDAKSRREALAKFVVTHDNFSKAYVNRIWGHLFGRGMNEQPSVDDFGEHNKVVHEELLEYLGAEFAKYNYDQKLLLEWICNSEAYQLSYVANETNNKPEAEPFFSRMPLKAMSPEQLFESLMEATKSDSEKAMSADERKALKNTWLNKLVRNFGDDEGNEMSFNGTVVQALLMMNGRELNSQLRREKNSAVQVAMDRANKLGKNDAEKIVLAIDELYLSALGRHVKRVANIPVVDPKTKKKYMSSELDIILNELKKAMATDPKFMSSVGYKAYLEDVFWALLNSNEFILNH